MTSSVTSAAELVAAMQALGIELRPDPLTGRVLYRPKDALPPDLLEQLQRRKPEVLALLVCADPAVRWRVEAMRPRMPRHGRWIPMIVACPDAASRDTPGMCWSCGEPKGPEGHYFCQPCQQARALVVNEAREDVPIGTSATAENGR